MHWQIVGYEEASVHGTQSHITFQSENNFYRAIIPLGGAGTLNAGQYQFAFNIHLPMTLPPTFKYKYGSDA